MCSHTLLKPLVDFRLKLNGLKGDDMWWSRETADSMPTSKPLRSSDFVQRFTSFGYEK